MTLHAALSRFKLSLFAGNGLKLVGLILLMSVCGISSQRQAQSLATRLLPGEQTALLEPLLFTTGHLEHKAQSHHQNKPTYGRARGNTSSMIEAKLFQKVEDAFMRRDQKDFSRLYKFFLASFPDSRRKNVLDEYKKKFFYDEPPAIEDISGALAEVSYFGAKTLEELDLFFGRLKKDGIASVQVNSVQLKDKRVYLFSYNLKKVGYYFPNPVGPMVDNLMEIIAAQAHKHELKIYALLPTRHHPYLNLISQYMIDESYDPLQNRTNPNGKLDLLNPKSKAYLLSLIKALAQTGVDGIVLSDDFTYEPQEGFSEAAILAYRAGTGMDVDLASLFVPVVHGKDKDIGLIADAGLDSIALWRTREIAQFLWELASEAKAQNNKLLIGIECTPEMLINETLSVRWYATGLKYLHDLPLDFFVIKWRKYGRDEQSDPDSYRKAVELLQAKLGKGKRAYIKVPLSQATSNVLILNRKIRLSAKQIKGKENLSMALGPISRIGPLDYALKRFQGKPLKKKQAKILPLQKSKTLEKPQSETLEKPQSETSNNKKQAELK